MGSFGLLKKNAEVLCNVFFFYCRSFNNLPKASDETCKGSPSGRHSGCFFFFTFYYYLKSGQNKLAENVWLHCRLYIWGGYFLL